MKNSNTYDETLFCFYTLCDYKEAYKLSTTYLKNDVGEAELELRHIRFLSALQLYLQDYKKDKVDPARMNNLLTWLDDFFLQDMPYTDEQFQSIPGIGNLLFGLMKAFQENFKSIEEQKMVAPLLMKFIQRLANDSIKDKTMQLFKSEGLKN